MSSQRFNTFVRFLIRWEGATNAKDGEDTEATYLRAMPFAFSNHRADSGGPTMMGVTLHLFTLWRMHICHLPQPAIDDLRKMSFSEWQDIVRNCCWLPVRADLMPYDCFAIALADWYWHSGKVAVLKAQTLLHAEPDAVVGRKTLFAARRLMSTRERGRQTATKLTETRREWLMCLAERRPKDRAFVEGWNNRLDALLAMFNTLDLLPGE